MPSALSGASGASAPTTWCLSTKRTAQDPRRVRRVLQPLPLPPVAGRKRAGASRDRERRRLRLRHSASRRAASRVPARGLSCAVSSRPARPWKCSAPGMSDRQFRASHRVERDHRGLARSSKLDRTINDRGADGFSGGTGTPNARHRGSVAATNLQGSGERPDGSVLNLASRPSRRRRRRQTTRPQRRKRRAANWYSSNRVAFAIVRRRQRHPGALRSGTVSSHGTVFPVLRDGATA